jgi:type VI secretion system protein VasG
MAANHDIPFTYTDAVLELIAARCTELESGGRMIDAILTNTILPQISRELLSRMAEGTPLKAIEIDARDDNFGYNFS